MKKVILTLLTFLSLHVSAAMVEKEISIDFQNFPELTMSPPLDFSTVANNGQTNCTNYKIVESPVTISFSKGLGTLGAAIYRIDDFYRLILRAFCEMIFEVSDGCQLTSIQFYNTNSISSCTPGRFDTNGNIWSPNGATDVTKVTLTNGISDSQIGRVTIKYLAPATPLNIIGSNPSDGDKPESFSTMQLSFNTEVSKVNAGNVTLTGTSFTGSKNMTVTASGSSATLKLAETITTPGTYTVHIPAGIFETSEGATNSAKDITFTIILKLNTFNPTDIDPKEGVVGALPQKITLTFSNFVKIGTGKIKFKQKDGNLSFTATATVQDTVATITHDYKYLDASEWTVEIEEKAFHNDFPEDDEDYRWNDKLTLTYTVDGSQAGPQDSETMKEAKQALDKTGVGYPKNTHPAWLALNNLVYAAETPADDALQAALTELYNVTEVQMPEEGNWYIIAGINSKGTKVYLTFNEDKTKVLLGTNRNKAAVFKVKSVSEGKTVFQTKEGWFLHVPHALINYNGTSKKNLTTEESDVNKLTLDKFLASSVSGADPKALYGALTIYGSLGTKNDKEFFAHAAISYADDDLDFATDPDPDVLLFSSGASSAFVFEDSEEPEEIVEYISPTLSFSPSSTIKKPGDELYLCITGPVNTEILDNSLICFMNGQKKQNLSQPILTVTDTPNKFSVYTKGLAAGATYQLVVQEGAFKYTNPEGKSVVDQELSISLTIGEVLTLTGSLSPTVLSSAEEEMVLTIGNVVDASLATNAQPYYQYADGDNKGQKVTYTGAILTKIADSQTQFKVNTSNLEPGSYTLVLPIGTFTYHAESGKEVEDAEIVLDFTISAPVEDFNYTYSNFVFVTTKDRNAKGIDVIRDVDLNDFVICVFDFWGYSGLYGNPNGKVSVRSTFGGDVVTGHFEEYVTADLVEKYGEEYQEAWALKFVPDIPIISGQLDDRPGMYAYYMYPGAVGDYNYMLYLSGDPNIKQTDCVVNPGMAASKYYVNNDKATGINNVSTDKGSRDVIFDLQGRRVTDTSRKGVYIINGKKVVIK